MLASFILVCSLAAGALSCNRNYSTIECVPASNISAFLARVFEEHRQAVVDRIFYSISISLSNITATCQERSRLLASCAIQVGKMILSAVS